MDGTTTHASAPAGDIFSLTNANTLSPTHTHTHTHPTRDHRPPNLNLPTRPTQAKESLPPVTTATAAAAVNFTRSPASLIAPGITHTPRSASANAAHGVVLVSRPGTGFVHAASFQGMQSPARSPLGSLTPHGMALLPSLAARRSPVSAPASPVSMGSGSSLGSSYMSEGKKARLQQALMMEKGKDTLLAKLKRKFILPDMPKELQDLIMAAIDELSMLPNVLMSDLEKVTKRIAKIKKEFYEKATDTVDKTIDENGDRIGPLLPPASRHGDEQDVHDIGQRLPSISNHEHSIIGSPPAPFFVYGSENDWGALIAANVRLDMTQQIQAREKAKEDQISMRGDLDIQVQSRKHRMQEDKEIDSFYEKEMRQSFQEAKLREDEELRLQELKLSQTRSERLKEIQDIQHHRSEVMHAEFEQQQKYAKSIQENIMHHHNLQVQEARQHYEELKKGLQENEQRRIARKERMTRELEEERNEIKRNMELYEKMKSVADEQINKQKANRLMRGAAVKYSPPKTIAQKAYEDEVKAQREVEEYEQRLKEDELRRIHQIIEAQDEVVRSNLEAAAFKEEMRKREREEKARLGEYMRTESEHIKNSEQLARKEAYEKSQEYARQLKEQMRSEQAKKKKERIAMSENEKRLNRQIFEQAGIFPRDSVH